MKKPRIVARLDVKGPNVVKGIQFEALRVIGKPGDLAEQYYKQGADEVLYIDIVASLYRRANLLHIVREASKRIFVPITAGGGVRSIEDIRQLLSAGADKVAINTGAINDPSLIQQAAEMFGSQCIVVSIEAKQKGDSWEALVDNGRQLTGRDAVEWAREAEQLGAGEILLTSVERDGTERGMNTALIRAVSSVVSIPVIAGGGVGSTEDIEAAVEAGANAVATATLLHYGKIGVDEIKATLRERGYPVRRVADALRVEAQPDPRGRTDYNRFTLRQFATPELGIDTQEPAHEEVIPIKAAEADIVVINYKLNNVQSVVNALTRLGKKVAIATGPDDVSVARALVLPGVGAFAHGMAALSEAGLADAIKQKVRSGTPLLGMCLGMQLLFDESEEFGSHAGLGLLAGRVVSLPKKEDVADPDYKLPHIGWSPLIAQRDWKETFLRDVEETEEMYFVHSFYPEPSDASCILASAEYGGKRFCAIVEQGNMSATQFHPERSGEAGMRIMEGFCKKHCI